MRKMNQTVLRLIVLGVILVAVLLSYRLNPEFFSTTSDLLVNGDIAGLINFIRSYGPYAMVISFLLVVFINIVAVLPNIFILAANGILFGVVEGTILSWLAESVGVIISFVFMRYLFHDYAHKLIVRSNALKRVDEFSGQKGFRIMVIARSIPYIPSGLITALGAVSSISLFDYTAATFVGKLPSSWIEVTLGHDLMAYREHSFRLVLLILISCLAYYLFIRYKRKEADKNS